MAMPKRGPNSKFKASLSSPGSGFSWPTTDEEVKAFDELMADEPSEETAEEETETTEEPGEVQGE